MGHLCVAGNNIPRVKVIYMKAEKKVYRIISYLVDECRGNRNWPTSPEVASCLSKSYIPSDPNLHTLEFISHVYSVVYSQGC